MQNLQTLRDGLDEIDTAIVYLFAKRFELTRQVGIFKSDHQLPPTDAVREKSQFERIAQKANEAGLDPAFAQKILRITIDEVVKNHRLLQHRTE
jgi:chorismate mutase